MYAAQWQRFGALIRFIISGGTAGVVLLVLLYVCTDVFGIWYLASSILAFMGAFATSFTLHKFWTFADPHLGRTATQAAVHLAVGLVNLSLNTFLLYVLVEFIDLHYLIAQILVSGCLALVSFFVYKYFIFHKGQYGATPEYQ